MIWHISPNECSCKLKHTYVGETVQYSLHNDAMHFILVMHLLKINANIKTTSVFSVDLVINSAVDTQISE